MDPKIMESIRNDIMLTKEDIAHFGKISYARLFSQALVGLAKAITSHLEYYPSPFYIKSLNYPKLKVPTVSKRDDISVVAGFIVEGKYSIEEAIKTRGQIAEYRKTNSEELAAAVPFLKNHIYNILNERLRPQATSQSQLNKKL